MYNHCSDANKIVSQYMMSLVVVQHFITPKTVFVCNHMYDFYFAPIIIAIFLNLLLWRKKYITFELGFCVIQSEQHRLSHADSDNHIRSVLCINKTALFILLKGTYTVTMLVNCMDFGFVWFSSNLSLNTV